MHVSSWGPVRTGIRRCPERTRSTPRLDRGCSRRKGCDHAVIHSASTARSGCARPPARARSGGAMTTAPDHHGDDHLGPPRTVGRTRVPGTRWAVPRRGSPSPHLLGLYLYRVDQLVLTAADPEELPAELRRLRELLGLPSFRRRVLADLLLHRFLLTEYDDERRNARRTARKPRGTLRRSPGLHRRGDARRRAPVPEGRVDAAAGRRRAASRRHAPRGSPWAPRSCSPSARRSSSRTWCRCSCSGCARSACPGG